MWRIEGICVSVTRGLQGRQRQEFELRLYSSGGTNLGVRDFRHEYDEEIGGRLSFKAINPNFLLKYDE